VAAIAALEETDLLERKPHRPTAAKGAAVRNSRKDAHLATPKPSPGSTTRDRQR
jgi:hypothetical protein